MTKLEILKKYEDIEYNFESYIPLDNVISKRIQNPRDACAISGSMKAV